jgi:hypothetical protein
MLLREYEIFRLRQRIPVLKFKDIPLRTSSQEEHQEGHNNIWVLCWPDGQPAR